MGTLPVLEFYPPIFGFLVIKINNLNNFFLRINFILYCIYNADILLYNSADENFAVGATVNAVIYKYQSIN